MHARHGEGPNPTEELKKQYEAAEKKYNAERAGRAISSQQYR